MAIAPPAVGRGGAALPREKGSGRHPRRLDVGVTACPIRSGAHTIRGGARPLRGGVRPFAVEFAPSAVDRRRVAPL